MNRRLTRISRLDAFGLTPAALRRLGPRTVTVEIQIGVSPYVYPSRSELRRLLRMTPQQRRVLVHDWRVRKHAALCKELPVRDFTVTKFNRAPTGVRFTLRADQVDQLRRLRSADNISVLSVEGLKAWKDLVVPPRLYAVKGHMVFQVEGQVRGTQLREERLTVVVARSEREAKARVARIMTAGHAPFLATSGHFIRWSFEGVSDVCECPDEQFMPKGTEVYYSYRRRRVRPQYEWHPARKRKTPPARANSRTRGARPQSR